LILLNLLLLDRIYNWLLRLHLRILLLLSSITGISRICSCDEELVASDVFVYFLLDSLLFLVLWQGELVFKFIFELVFGLNWEQSLVRLRSIFMLKRLVGEVICQHQRGFLFFPALKSPQVSRRVKALIDDPASSFIHPLNQGKTELVTLDSERVSSDVQ
jgi:hypothetical protein